ncbi:epimerase [Cellulomonas bogoriensis 69B4 = DSM 16987]|uniref:Epimerase n=1 Tax=Cellulomonas bogoriensis 69B4 = DSM 16987 TaxID=1386082 RepID=A0A0A0C225_9CELL|nr:epimerase [Cellulomonas bogoriensis 69B4 = DSM 16987]
MLGGTEFLGVHLVEGLLAAGWEVTLFNRGLTGPDLFASSVRLRGDRDGDVSALAGGEWDVVFDLSAYHPDQVVRSARYLVDRCRHYVLVSSVSVYAHLPGPGTTEDGVLARIEGPVPREVDGASYGPLKVLCEERVTELFPSRTVVRPTVVVGPGDPSDRFTYWVRRLAEGGAHVVPPDMTRPVQHIDARDLAAWMVGLGAGRVNGVFNAAAEPVPFGDLAQVIADVAGVDLRPVQLTGEQMTVEGVRPWADLPLWLPPEDVDMRGFFQVDASRAVHAGLRVRPLADTVRDTLEWARGRDDDELRTGLSRERDQDLAARYAPGS